LTPSRRFRQNPPMPQPVPPSLRAYLDLLVRWRLGLYAVLGFTFIAGFNGQWRIGRDSAAYRGIARNLVRAHRYEYRPKITEAQSYADKQDTLYPGLPLVLAGMQIVFGEGSLPPLILMYALGVITLVMTERLVRRAGGPPWLAVAVVSLLGFNSFFLEHANDLLTDLPFLLGVVVALCGFEDLTSVERPPRSLPGAIAMTTIGLVLAASMRPTFWFLALAWSGACAWGLIFGSHRPRPREEADSAESRSATRIGYLVALGLLLVVMVLMWRVDPRTKPAGAKSGGYEARVARQVSDTRKFLGTLRGKYAKTLVEHLPAAFFGTTVKSGSHVVRGLAVAYSLMVILPGVWLVRRNVLWGALVLVTVGGAATLGDAPRYYLMILPLLLIGWATFCFEVARRMDWFRYLPALAMFWGLSVVLVPNWLRDLDFIRVQRGFDPSLHRTSFIEAYKAGPTVRMAEMIRQHTEPRQRTFAPESTAASFLADRYVYGLDRLLPAKDRPSWPKRLAELHFDYGVFPEPGTRAMDLYGDKETFGAEMIDAGLVVPTDEIARTSDGYRLCRFRIVGTPP
jgi:hypothetical protein